MTGGSMEGSRSLISDSSNAIAALYSKRMSMKSCFSTGVRNPGLIFIAVRHSGVSHDPRGIIFPVVGSSGVLGLMPSGSGTLAGSTFQPFHLYIILMNMSYCFQVKTFFYFPLDRMGDD